MQENETTVRTRRRLAVPAIVAALSMPLGVGSAVAEEFSNTDVQFLYSTRSKADAVNGTGTRDEKLWAMRAEHFGTWSHGDNYLFLDLYQGNQVGGPGAASFGGDGKRQYFFGWVPRLSLSKLTGRDLSAGFVRDVYLAYRMERASYGDFSADNYGVSFNLAVPGTAFFEQDFYARKTNYDNGTKFLSRTVWLAPFSVGPLNMHFDGLLLVKTTDKNGTDVFAQPDLLVDLLPKGQMQAGVRLEHHSHRNYSRTSPFAMLKWVF